jgi:hypothetical protein
MPNKSTPYYVAHLANNNGETRTHEHAYRNNNGKKFTAAQLTKRIEKQNGYRNYSIVRIEIRHFEAQ